MIVMIAGISLPLAVQPSAKLPPGPKARPLGWQLSTGSIFTSLPVFGSITATPPFFSSFLSSGIAT